MIGMQTQDATAAHEEGRFLDFPREEFEERLRAMQASMDAEGIDRLLLSHVDNAYYFTGYRSWLRISQHRPILTLISRQGPPILLLPGLEAGNAALRSWVDEVIAWQDQLQLLAHVRSLLSGVGTVGIELGEDMWLGMPNHFFGQLRDAIPTAEWVDATPMLWKQRSIKSQHEISYLRKAARCCDRAVQSAWEALRPGITEQDVARRIGQQMLEEGSDGPLFLAVKSGTGSTSAGNKYATEKRIGEDEIVTVDVGCSYAGYASDMIRSATMGSPPKDLLRTYELAVAMADACLAEVRDGAAIATIDRARTDFLAHNGLPVPPYAGVGHSIGIAVHELPRIGPDQPGVLRTGMVVNIEPSIRISQFGGLAIEDTVVVTDTGFEFLTTSPRKLQRPSAGAGRW